MQRSLRRAACLTLVAVVCLSVLVTSIPIRGVGDPITLKVDIIGDSYTSGEGMTGTYFDPGDRRHRSPFSAAGQALQRLVWANPNAEFDATIGASSGAVTGDYFNKQVRDDTVINPPQREFVRSDADAVVVGFGGNDASFARVLRTAWESSMADGGSPKLDKLLDELAPMLDSSLTPTQYQWQIERAEPGAAETVTARVLEVLQDVKDQAPEAGLVVPNYPLAVDPESTSLWGWYSEYELDRIREFGKQLNASIGKAVEVCGCATLADLTDSLAGREVYTADPAINDLGVRLTGDKRQWNQLEPFHPNVAGGALMSGPIGEALAAELGLQLPGSFRDRPTPFSGLREAEQ